MDQAAIHPDEAAGAGRAATRDELLRWVETIAGARAQNCFEISGGNRCQSWGVDVAGPDGRIQPLYLRYQPPRPPSAEPYTVWREAKIYAALRGSKVPAPRLIAIHPDVQAILTERVAGRAEYRRIEDQRERVTIIQEFVAALARLHQMPLENLDRPGLVHGASIAECVRQELAVWSAMYAEAGRTDALIDLALGWLAHNVPNPPGLPVLVHGDAGPGNFLYEAGHMTALLDWELAHPGDPMEDLAWFSMRAVMEPVPDFAQRIREYGQMTGTAADFDRIRYHRVFVSARVVIIRHRNITGQPGNSIVSRALNRRLLVAALAAANDVALPALAPMQVPPTAQTLLYDAIIADLRHDIAANSTDGRVLAAAKNAAKVLKFLRATDRYGQAVARDDHAALLALLGHRPASIEAGQAEMLTQMRRGQLSFAQVLGLFAGCVQREASLAAASSGGLANRLFPSLVEEHPNNV